MDQEWIDDLLRLYKDGKYLEINFNELCDRCGGENEAWKWLREKGISFAFKPYNFKVKGSKKHTRAKDYDNIAMSRNYRFMPKSYVAPIDSA